VAAAIPDIIAGPTIPVIAAILGRRRPDRRAYRRTDRDPLSDTDSAHDRSERGSAGGADRATARRAA